LAAEMDLGGGAYSVRDNGQPIQYSVMVLEEGCITVYQTRDRRVMLDAVGRVAAGHCPYTVWRRSVRPHEQRAERGRGCAV